MKRTILFFLLFPTLMTEAQESDPAGIRVEITADLGGTLTEMTGDPGLVEYDSKGGMAFGFGVGVHHRWNGPVSFGGEVGLWRGTFRATENCLVCDEYPISTMNYGLNSFYLDMIGRGYVLSGRTDLYLGAGVGMNNVLRIKETRSLPGQEGRQEFNQTDSVSRLGLRLPFSIGVNYYLGPRLSLTAEARFNWIATPLIADRIKMVSSLQGRLALVYRF